MPSDIYWIKTANAKRLAIMARPRSGDWLEDEIAYWEQAGIEVVVSLLEREEIEDLELQREEALCVERGIQFLSFPIPDRGLPDDINAAMRFAKEIALNGKATAIHCRAGIGRSSLVAAAVMISDGEGAEWVMNVIQEARGLPIPDTDAQRAWIMKLELRQ